MLASIALQAVLLATKTTAPDAAPQVAPVCVARPPVRAKVEGRIVAPGGTPVPNVEVRATVGGQGEYTTSSDEHGRYVVTRFDAGEEVFLEFRDRQKHALVACSVHSTPRDPSVSLGVTIDSPGTVEADSRLGCILPKDDAWKGSWVGGDRAYFVHQPDAQSDLDALPRLSLSSSDIVEVRMHDNAASLRLTPAGTKSLEAFTEANVGRMTLTTIDGEPAGRFVVQATIPSGMMSVSEAFLRGKPLCILLDRLSRKP